MPTDKLRQLVVEEKQDEGGVGSVTELMKDWLEEKVEEKVGWVAS